MKLQAVWTESNLVLLQYVKDDKPIERLLEYMKCPNICGATIVNLIIKALNEVGLNIKKCRAQTYDGAGNMVREQQGATNQLKLFRFYKTTFNSTRRVWHGCSKWLHECHHLDEWVEGKANATKRTSLEEFLEM